MESARKRTIYVKTPSIVYDEAPTKTLFQVPNSKSALNLMEGRKQYEPSVSYKHVEKLKGDLIKFEKLDIKKLDLNSNSTHRNLVCRNSRLVIRPKILKTSSNEKIRSLLIKQDSFSFIERHSHKFSSVNKQRASKFFFNPKQKSPMFDAQQFMQRMNKKRVYGGQKK